MFLGLGSNRGDSPAVLRRALEELSGHLQGMRVSRWYRSEPLYVLDQDRYLNGACCGSYAGTPHSLLGIIHSIEARGGRDRSVERRFGERTLDIDILLFGKEIVAEGEQLSIPHPRLLERKFALLPLLELDPCLADPRTGSLLADKLLALGPQGIYYASLEPYN